MKLPGLISLTPLLRWFLFTMVLANIGSQMAYAMLPLYLADLGASVAQIGLAFSAASVVLLVLQVIGGWLSDTIGRLRAIAIGSGLATLGYFGFWLSPSWPWALLSMCVEYISGALVAPSFGAFVAEQSSEAQRGRVFGFSQGILMLVVVIGPPLGGALAFRLGFRPMLLVAAILYTIAAALRSWMALTISEQRARPNPPPSLRQFRSHLGALYTLVVSGGVLTWILITDGIRDVASRLSDELRPLYLAQVSGLNLEQIGLLTAVAGIAMMLSMLPSGWLGDRYGERVSIVSGFGLQFAGLLLFLNVSGLAGIAGSVFVFGCGLGLVFPAYNALISKVVPENLRGAAFGLFWTSVGFVSLPAPWIGAQLWTRFNPRLPFWITAFATLLAIWPVWTRFRRTAQPDPDLPPA
ncbi:MAG TPA: MFS transporter [Anaerolineales bacterium]|nr:MFS transporter [Anaerolineales bacterium]